MSSTSRRIRNRRCGAWLAAPVASLLLAAACSGGDDDAANTATAGSAPPAAAASASGPSSTASEPATASTGSGAPGTSAAVEGANPAVTSPSTTASAVANGITAITVESTTEQYFVLYVRPVLDAPLELPVAIARGGAGSTTLTDGRSELPEAHYRVASFPVSSPGDVDGDGIDDLTELDGIEGGNPLNPAPELDPGTGANLIADRETFELLSYQGDQVARDSYLAGLEYVKFWIVDTDTDHPAVYFMNTETYRAHPDFGNDVGIASGRGPAPGKLRGDIVYLPDAQAPDGSQGVYRFAFQPNDAYPFSEIALAYEVLAASMPMLDNNLLYYPFPQSALPLYERERATYDAYRVPVLVEQ